MRLLLVEDEISMRTLLSRRLGNMYAIDSCETERDAYLRLKKENYDLVLLDLVLKEGSGIHLLETLRKEGNEIPVLIITAKDQVEDRVRGLRLGADDYLIKPFHFAELDARIQARIRRRSTAGLRILQIGDLVVNTETHAVNRAERVVHLTETEYRMLAYLMQNAGLIVTHRQLEECVWNSSDVSCTGLERVYICSLRRKIDTDGEQKLIHTIHGLGYMITAD